VMNRKKVFRAVAVANVALIAWFASSRKGKFLICWGAGSGRPALPARRGDHRRCSPSDPGKAINRHATGESVPQED
jgi:hypothetical protein